MGEWELVFYETANGHRPVQEYLERQPAREQARIGRDLAVLERHGNLLGFPLTSHVVGKLRELRITGGLSHRVFYFFFTGGEIVLVHAYLKKTAQAPRKEIDTALRRMADHLERSGR